MVLLRICGGLGNQMLFYATARAIEDGTNHEVVFYVDDSLTSEHWQYELQLNHLNVKNFKFLHSSKIECVDFIDWNTPIVSLYNTYYNSLNNTLNRSNNYYVEGFGFSENFLKHLEKDLKKELKVKTAPSIENVKMLSMIRNTNSVAVHIRLYKEGSGTTDPKAVIFCGMDYYNNAVKVIKEKAGPNPVFYIFCLEIEWAKENFKIDGDMVFVELENPAHEELRLLYSCKHFIAAASTLSWCANYLFENKSGIKIHPPFFETIFLNG